MFRLLLYIKFIRKGEEMAERNEVLPGVKCEVNTCYYNKNGNRCTASAIEITPKNAKNSDDTDCNTFRQEFR